MSKKNILQIVIVISFIVALGIFIQEQFKKAYIQRIIDQPIEFPQKKDLCKNSMYSTVYYPSNVGEYGRTIQLDNQSLSLLETKINLNKGKIPAGSLDGLDCIEELRIVETNLNNLEEIGNLKSVKVLILQSNYISDLSPLSKMNNIKLLNLNQNYDISDLSPLSNIKTLEKLFVSYTQVSDLNPISNLLNLNELSVSWTNVEDISPLKNLMNLKTLYIRELPITNENAANLRSNTKLTIIAN